MRWWFVWGVLFDHGMICQGISIIWGSLRLVSLEVFLLVDILLEFPERGVPCSLLGAILLPGPRWTLRGTNLFSERWLVLPFILLTLKNVQTFLVKLGCVFCGGVGIGGYLNYCGIINEALAYELCCVSWNEAFEGCTIACFSQTVIGHQ